MPFMLWWIVGGAALASVAYLVWYNAEPQVNLRAIRERRPVLIRDVPAGEHVRITGRLHTREHSLVAPLSGRACAHFELVIEELVSDGDSSSWRRVVREIQSTDFELEDESGRAMVETASLIATVVLHHKEEAIDEPTRAKVERILERHDQKPTGLFGMKRRFRYAEGVLEPGEEVSVLGRARWEDDPEPGSSGPSAGGGYRASARRQRLVIERSGEPVRASDRPETLERSDAPR